jgi:glycosyltransferase involved in cell wall biosynthesis
MTIGIDISPLQGPHRMRGIGATIIQTINHISVADRMAHKFVFYAVDDSETTYSDPLELLDLSDMNYEVRPTDYPHDQMRHKLIQNRASQSHPKWQRHMPGAVFKLTNSITGLYDGIITAYSGDKRSQDLSGLDVYLQANPDQNLPRNKNVHKVVILYDIIPYVLGSDYLPSYRDARIRNHSIKGSVRLQLLRSLYALRMRNNVASADSALAISAHTKSDFVKYLGVDENKITVTPLGVSELYKPASARPALVRYKATSWGYIRCSFDLDTSRPYLLFVGGADSRRRLADLVAAYNHLRAEGHDLQLVLVGDTMQGARNIPTPDIQNALLRTSYIDDIIFMGFVGDDTRDWLYRNAWAFIYPSVYEGFGLPVLEAMSYGCPVVCYDNGAVREVAGTSVTYATDCESLYAALIKLLAANEKDMAAMRLKGIKQAAKYTWHNTSRQIIRELTKN